MFIVNREYVKIVKNGIVML